MKWLRWSVLVVVAVLLVAAAAATWVVGTTAGARWVFQRAGAAIEERLAAEAIEGTLAGALTLRGLHYGSEDSPLEVQAQRAFVNLAFADLFTGTVHIDAAAIEGLLVAMRESAQEKPEEPRQPFDLEPPVDIVLDELTVERGSIRSGGESLVDIRTFQFAGRWTDAGIEIGQLDLNAAQGTVTLQGGVRQGDVYTGQAQGDFQWQLEQTSIAGSLQAETTEGVLQATIDLSAPTDAELALEISQQERIPWSFELDVPRFDPQALAGDSLESLAASLQGSGTQAGGSIRGRIVVNDEPLVLQPLQFTRAQDRIGLDATALVAGTEGELRVEGDIRLEPAPLNADLEMRWEEVQLPAAWVGQRLNTHGHLMLSGSAESFSADGTLSLGPPDRVADIELALQGSPERIQIEQLDVTQPTGRLAVNGELELQPAVQWDLQATATKFDPGAFLAAWQGDLNFELATQGSVTQKGPQGELHLRDLRGRLRNRPLSGSADLTLTPEPVLAGHLTLASGESRIRLRGERGQVWDAIASFEIASLDDWVPHASGTASGRFSIEGEWPALHVSGNARASEVHVADISIDSARLQADIENPRAPTGSARLVLSGASAAGFAVASGTLQLSGDPQQHSVELDATGDPVSVQLTVQGSRSQSEGSDRWIETFQRLALDLEQVGEFSLDEPATVTVALPAVEVSQTCLVNAQTRLCASGSLAQDGALNARYSIEELPLALANAVAPTLPFELSGSIAGEGEIRRDAAGRMYGELGLRSAQGAIAQPDVADAQGRPLLTYEDLQLQARLDGTDAQATLGAQLDESGSLDGSFSVSGLGSPTRPIDGALTARMPDLSALTLLTPQLANTQGTLQLQAGIDGTLVDPAIQAELHASDLAADIPALGLNLKNGTLDVEPRGDEAVALSGSIQSGDGRITFDGTATYAGEVTLDVEGQQFLAADLPGARVVAAPDLNFERDGERMTLSGKVRLPAATINVQKLPRVVRAQTGSPDVVVIDAKTQQEAQAEGVPLYADVEVILGEEVNLSGFGLEAQLHGQLAVHEVPGEETTGSGEIRVDGTYKAYGQDLTITQGSLLYAGTPLDNPSLRIVAVRKVEDVTAGLRIAGTAQAPELTLFADPAMDDANALSYLVAGRPLDDIGAGDEDTDALQSAARSLGTAAGGLLSKRLGKRLGIDTVGVEESEVLEGSAFTVGEYLSPRLYLSYGVGLFVPGDVITLRYRLSDEVALRAVRGPDDTRAGIEYRVEK